VPNYAAIALATIPDIETGRCLYELGDLEDSGVAKAMYHLHKQTSGTDELPLFLQSIAGICVRMTRADGYSQSLFVGKNIDDEQQLLIQFLAWIKENNLTMLAWKGDSFDYPILHYRLLKLGFHSLDFSQHVSLDKRVMPFANQKMPSLREISCLFDLQELPHYGSRDIWQSYIGKQSIDIQTHTEARAERVFAIANKLKMC
jgi:predicted PolB exonuclease-like 3'-5' exonuclease